MTSNAVVVCTWGEDRDGLPSGAEEPLTLGHKLSASLGTGLEWLVLGPLPETVPEAAGRYGVAGIQRIGDARLDSFQADPYVEALAQYCTQRSPKLMLFPQNLDSRLAAPRLAGRLGTAVVINGVDLEADADGGIRITASAYGGDTRVVYELAAGGPHVVAVMANATSPEPLETPAPAPAVEEVAVDLAGVEERIRVLEPARFEGPRLEDAEIIVCGGRGLGEPENYKLVEELAQVLGGLPGASRPLVDDGWVDSSKQVGLTGKITRPALYVAAGVSGASQHMAGCAASKTIVAINTDADAAIFRHARYGIVGDCVEILPELIRAAKQR
ncbi:MAG: electron transfer flavoprotein subunit alpha/FixB family protein [Deltaproteobacteria bacterium]|nr:electron transfer flavoprotein subunit alpha/FixB family protein [Deltaproteobacteria bacterium]